MTSILVPATEALVEGWTGPLLYDGMVGGPCSVALIGPDNYPSSHGVLTVLPHTGDWGHGGDTTAMAASARLDEVALDLLRPEVQARVLPLVEDAVERKIGRQPSVAAGVAAGVAWARLPDSPVRWGLIRLCPSIWRRPTLVFDESNVPGLADVDHKLPYSDLYALQAVILWLQAEGRL